MDNKFETVACLVCEQTTEPQKVKWKEVKRDGVHFIKFKSLLQTYNVWNRNKRNYFLEPMKKSWNAPHLKELIQRGDFWGEYGHPITTDPKRIVTIDQKYCSHRFTNVWFQGNSIYGDVETLNDDGYGKMFRMRTMQGCDPAFSLRAMVPLTKIDATRCEIREPGHIITVDSVILPSHDDAYIVENAGFGAIESVAHLGENGNENITVPVTESTEFLSYLKDESFNLKTVMDHFEIKADKMHYDPTTESVMISESTPNPAVKMSAIVKMDDYLRKEISNMFANF